MIMICFVLFFATEEDPFGAETFCQQEKLSTTRLTLKNQQIPHSLSSRNMREGGHYSLFIFYTRDN